MIGAAREREFCHQRAEAYERDRYGRVLAVLRLDGSDVADAMLETGLAVPFPLGFKPNWCT
jgi:endonuclease YncB( thermonuclease family)